MTRPLIIVGAGGFGRECISVVAAMNAATTPPPFDLLGVVDDNPSDLNLSRLAELGVPYLGTIAEWRDDASFAVAVGSPDARASIVHELERRDLTAATIIHPQSTLGPRSVVAEGAVICAGVQISTNVTIGRHVHVNPNATIGHDSTLGAYTSINPAAVVSGDVTTGDRVLVGAGAVVLQGLTLHAGSLVGAAACVVRDVPPGTTVKGVPAR